VKHRIGFLALLVLLAGCITVTRTGGKDDEPPTPDPYEGEVPPPLQPSEEPGWFIAPSLDTTLYYSEDEDLWYRYAYNRWYLAYRWNGAWWVPDSTPAFLQTQVQVAEEKQGSVREQLKELEERLKESARSRKRPRRRSARAATAPTDAARRRGLRRRQDA